MQGPNEDGVLLVARSGRDAIVSVAAARALAAVGAGEREKPLRVGDLLRTEDGAEAVVGAIEDKVNGGDIAWPGVSGRARVHKAGDATARLEARSVGQYSLLTKRPLGRNTRFPAQKVGVAAMTELVRRGARFLAEELWTVRSDDEEGTLTGGGRNGLYASIVEGTPRSRPSSPPLAARGAEALLRALGFDVDLRAEAPTIALATNAAIRRWASGEIVKEESLDDRGARIRGGLLCPDVFGEPESTECWTRLGKIELPVPVVHPWAVPAVASLLDVTEDHVRGVLYDHSFDEQGGDAGLPPSWRFGAGALRPRLAAIDLAALARLEGDRGELARLLVASGLGAGDLLLDVLPVLPADQRQVMLREDGVLLRSDLDPHYEAVVHRRTSLSRLIGLNAPPVLLQAQARLLQSAVSNLFQNGIHQGELRRRDRAYRSLAALAAGETRMPGLKPDGKRVDYSGAAVAVEVGGLNGSTPLRARVPRDAALEMWKPWLYGRLKAEGHAASIRAAKSMVEAKDPRAVAALHHVIARHPIVLITEEGPDAKVLGVEASVWDEPALALPPKAIRWLGVAPGERVGMFVPVDPRACEEARSCLGMSDPPRRLDAGRGWIARVAQASSEELGRVLFEAALCRERDEDGGILRQLVLGRFSEPPRTPEVAG